MRELILGTKGRIFSVTFVKANGEERKLIGRVGVKKFVKGTGGRYKPEDYDLITLFDMQKMAYRMVNLKTIKELSINKQTIKP